MPRTIMIDGKAHVFPDDAKDEEISQALNDFSAAILMKASYRPSPSFQQTPQVFPKVKRNRQEDKMAKFIERTPQEIADDAAPDSDPANFAELEKELAKATSPKARAILQAERDRLAPMLKILTAR